jgi:hypothetical protein
MMSDKPPKVQDISGEAARQLPDQRVEDNAFHLRVLRLTFNASKKLDQFLPNIYKAVSLHLEVF